MDVFADSLIVPSVLRFKETLSEVSFNIMFSEVSIMFFVPEILTLLFDSMVVLVLLIPNSEPVIDTELLSPLEEISIVFPSIRMDFSVSLDMSST